MCGKGKNGAECIRGIKNINLMKYKYLMSKFHRTKSLSKGIMIVFVKQRVRKFGSLGLSQRKSSCKRICYNLGQNC